jgi:hypothetical protein
MQFTGTKGVTLFVALVVGSCAVGFGSGLVIGRHFPARTFQKYGETRYLLDSASGKLCDPFKDPNANVIDQKLVGSPPPGFVLEGTQNTDGTIKPIQSNYPPACGK